MTSAPPLPTARRLLFADEFDVPGPPDPARWDYQLEMRYRDSDAQFTDRPANVRVEDGQLVIEARREDAQGRRYTSAELVTLDRFTFCYGRVEVRARLPGGRGTWPGVWLCGANIREVSWPACGEADIVERGLLGSQARDRRGGAAAAALRRSRPGVRTGVTFRRTPSARSRGRPHGRPSAG